MRDNPRIRSPSSLPLIFGTQYFGGPPRSGTAYRPVLLLSFAVEWWIHGGDATAFRAVNVLLHAAATLLLARFLLDSSSAAQSPSARRCSSPSIRSTSRPSPASSGEGDAGRGADPALAPPRDAVHQVGGRAALAPVRGAPVRARRVFARGPDQGERAVAPALLFLALAWRSREASGAGLLRAADRGWPYAAGGAAVLAGVFAVRALVLGGAIKSTGTGIFELENPLALLSPASRAANASAVLFRYMGRLALPLRLSADESAWSIPVAGPRSAAYWAAPLLLGALVAVSGWRVASRRTAALGFLLFFLPFLPASNLLFPTGTIFAERLAYLPSAGLCVIAAAAIAGRAPGLRSLSPARLSALAAAVLLLAARTIVRNPVWESDESLFTNLIRVAPGSAKAHYDFAYMSVAEGACRRRWRSTRGRRRSTRSTGTPGPARTLRAPARPARPRGRGLRALGQRPALVRERLVRPRRRPRGARRPRGRREGVPRRAPADAAVSPPGVPARRAPLPGAPSGGDPRVAPRHRDRAWLSSFARRLRGATHYARGAEDARREARGDAADGAEVRTGAAAEEEARCGRLRHISER